MQADEPARVPQRPRRPRKPAYRLDMQAGPLHVSAQFRSLDPVRAEAVVREGRRVVLRCEFFVAASLDDLRMRTSGPTLLEICRRFVALMDGLEQDAGMGLRETN